MAEKRPLRRSLIKWAIAGFAGVNTLIDEPHHTSTEKAPEPTSEEQLYALVPALRAKLLDRDAMSKVGRLSPLTDAEILTEIESNLASIKKLDRKKAADKRGFLALRMEMLVPFLQDAVRLGAGKIVAKTTGFFPDFRIMAIEISTQPNKITGTSFNFNYRLDEDIRANYARDGKPDLSKEELFEALGATGWVNKIDQPPREQGR